MILLGVYSLPVFLAPSDDRWDALTSVATVLAVIVALFSDEIQKLVYRARIEFCAENELTTFGLGVLWVRGKVTNSGDRAVKRCRLKLLRIEDQPSGIENGLLQWQGGIREPIRLSSKEHLIFDIGTRTPNHGSPLKLLAYIGANQLAHDLPAGNTPQNWNTYRLRLAIYGDNIRTQIENVRIAVGPAPGDTDVS